MSNKNNIWVKKCSPDIIVKIGSILSIIFGILIYCVLTFIVFYPNTGLVAFSNFRWNVSAIIILFVCVIVNSYFSFRVLFGVAKNKDLAIIISFFFSGIIPSLFIIFGKYNLLKLNKSKPPVKKLNK